MRLPAIALSLLAVLLLISASATADSIYNLVSYPSDQNGYTLSGYVTTNGTIGSLSASDITSWSFTISNGTDSYITSSDSPLGTLLSTKGLQATATQILIPAAPADADFFVNMGENAYYAYLNWIRWRSPGAGQYMCLLPYPHNYETAWNVYSPGMGGTDPWVIAQTVPEPSTLALLRIGLVGLIAFGWRQSRG